MSFFVSESIADKINLDVAQKETSISLIFKNFKFDIESIVFKKKKIIIEFYANKNALNDFITCDVNCTINFDNYKKSIKDIKFKSIKRVKNDMYIIKIKAIETGVSND